MDNVILLVVQQLREYQVPHLNAHACGHASMSAWTHNSKTQKKWALRQICTITLVFKVIWRILCLSRGPSDRYLTLDPETLLPHFYQHLWVKLLTLTPWSRLCCGDLVRKNAGWFRVQTACGGFSMVKDWLFNVFVLQQMIITQLFLRAFGFTCLHGSVLKHTERMIIGYYGQ